MLRHLSVFGGGGSEGGEQGPGEGPKYRFNVLNTSIALDVLPEQPVLTGRLLRGKGRAAGPGEMLISPVWVEFWLGFCFFPWVQTKHYK